MTEPFTVVSAQTFAVELLEAIFLYCLPSDNHTYMKRNCVPLNVSQVCRHWRRVTLDIARLWSNLHIIMDDDESILMKIVPLTRLWLTRSRTLSISVHVESLRNAERSTSPDSDDSSLGSVSWESMEPVFTELAQHSSRLKGLILTLSGRCCYKAFPFIDVGFP